MSTQPTRRAFTARSLRLALGASLLHWTAGAGALAGTLRTSARPWLQQLDAVSAAAADGTLAPAGWQKEVEAVLGRMDLRDFLKSIDFEALAAKANFPAQGEGMERLYLLDDEGRLQVLRFRPFLFTLRRDTAVVPHGHHNMATMHMMLAGRARVRHFDRLESTPTHMVIRPVSDAEAAPGHVSSISDEGHNVHWFESLTDRVFMFNIGVYQLRPGQPFGERDYVDPLGGAALEGGALLAPRLTARAAYEKYGPA